jgi:hypothetical protein
MLNKTVMKTAIENDEYRAETSGQVGSFGSLRYK